MSHYLLIESRDPFESRAVDGNRRLARSLAEAGEDVAIFLVQNGVLAARREVAQQRGLESLPEGIPILCDDLSLRERGIRESELAARVEVAEVDVVIDHMCQGRRVLWL